MAAPNPYIVILSILTTLVLWIFLLVVVISTFTIIGNKVKKKNIFNKQAKVLLIVSAVLLFTFFISRVAINRWEISHTVQECDLC